MLRAPSQSFPWGNLDVSEKRPKLRLLFQVGWAVPIGRQNPALCLPTYHDAMMALRASRTSAAARRCWGSRTNSFRMRHTVFSETRPSLMGEGGGEGKASSGQAGAGSQTQDSGHPFPPQGGRTHSGMVYSAALIFRKSSCGMLS